MYTDRYPYDPKFDLPYINVVCRKYLEFRIRLNRRIVTQCRCGRR